MTTVIASVFTRLLFIYATWYVELNAYLEIKNMFFNKLIAEDCHFAKHANLCKRWIVQGNLHIKGTT